MDELDFPLVCVLLAFAILFASLCMSNCGEEVFIGNIELVKLESYERVSYFYLFRNTSKGWKLTFENGVVIRLGSSGKEYRVGKSYNIYKKGRCYKIKEKDVSNIDT